MEAENVEEVYTNESEILSRLGFEIRNKIELSKSGNTSCSMFDTLISYSFRHILSDIW